MQLLKYFLTFVTFVFSNSLIHIHVHMYRAKIFERCLKSKLRVLDTQRVHRKTIKLFSSDLEIRRFASESF